MKTIFIKDERLREIERKFNIKLDEEDNDLFNDLKREIIYLKWKKQ